MRKIAAAGVLLSAALTCALLVAWGEGVTIAPDPGAIARPVPTRATREAWLLAYALARRGVPAGLIVPHETSPDTRGPALGDEPLANALARFNRENTEFAATDDNGIVHIRPRARPAAIDHWLTRSLQRPESVAYSLEAAVHATGELLWNGVFKCRGSVGSYLGGRAHCLDLRVRVAAGQTSPLRVLDAIARQHPGISWVVTYDSYDTASADDLRVGIVCPGGGNLLACSGRSRGCG
jgi:hypothetical protein